MKEKLVVRIDPVLHMLGFLTMLDRGFYDQSGIEVDLYVLTQMERDGDLRGDPYVHLDEGVVDVSANGVTTMHLEAVRAGRDFKVVASRGDLVAESSGWLLIARKDLHDSGRIRSTEDMVDKVLGVPGRAEGRSYPHILAVKDLEQNGMTTDDLGGVYVDGPWAITQALERQEIDATWLQPGFADEAFARNLAVPIKRDWDVMQTRVPLGVISYSGRFLRERPSVGVEFMRGYQRGLELLRNPDPQEMGRVTKKYLGLSEGIVAGLVGTTSWPYVPDQGRIDLDDLDRFQAQNHRLGLLRGEPVPAAEWVDQSFIDEAT